LAIKAILRVVEYDFKNFFRFRWFIVGLIAMNLADLFISAVVFSQMTSIVDYFRFFAPGLAVVGLFASAFMIGREINMEVRREIHHYLLSLPMTRTELAIGISGVSISIAVSTTSFEKFVTARGVVYYLLFFCSSVFYPLSVISVLATKGLGILVTFAQVNPLTNGSDLIRSFLLNSSSGYVFSPLMLLNVAVFSGIFASLAVFAYSKILQRH